MTIEKSELFFYRYNKCRMQLQTIVYGKWLNVLYSARSSNRFPSQLLKVMGEDKDFVYFCSEEEIRLSKEELPPANESEMNYALNNQKIMAIKCYRERNNMGLAEAKEAVERGMRQRGFLPNGKSA